ncbi:alcohol oxidase [Hortaea werneckii]|nr:alcohol oxidase [Hortaea werneckii]
MRKKRCFWGIWLIASTTGTAGLTLAARLSEIPSVSVAVLEAGLDRSDDPNILAPGLLTALYGDPDYDWIYKTVPQEHVNDRVIGQPRGKQLGGSSAINYLAYTHASQTNIDNFGLLGNENWTWAQLEPYYTKSEHYTQVSEEVISDLNVSWIDPAIHGQSGPVFNSFPDEYSPLDEAWPRAYETLGIGVDSDPRDGLALGGYNILTNINKTNGVTRSYAATAYLNPIKDRSNLAVYTGAMVQKINFDTSSGTPCATSVSVNVNGTDYVIEASTEVLLSGGAFGSPQMLELSGVGNSTLLESLGIETILDQPAVGENLQDHVYMPLGYQVVDGITTLDDLVNETFFNEAYDQYLENGTGILAQVALGGALLSLNQILPDSEEFNTFKNHYLNEVQTNYPYDNSLSRQYNLIINDVEQGQEVAQHMNTASGMNPVFANDTTKLFSPPTPGNYFTILGVLEHPLSRGTVHIHKNDPSVHPLIDPHYLEHPADLAMLSKIALHIQNKLAQAYPLSSVLKDNGTLYQDVYTTLTEENVESEVKRLLQSEYHPSGTCAMLPRDASGVVDPRFNVYGIDRLRVIDASIVPLQPRANLQTFVYAIAERAADFIKEDYFASQGS